MTRRKFLALAGLALPATLGADVCIEPTALRVTRLDLKTGGKLRLVHFSDLHFKGDTHYAARVVRRINDLAPDLVLFTGDLVEERHFAGPALDYIRQINRPVYGCPGNHDYWCHASFADYHTAFESTGGAWLVDQALVLPEHDLEVVGMGVIGIHALKDSQAKRRILLNHYPAMSDQLHGRRFDLILSGHSHGGQVRLPFYGALFVPWGVGRYDLGFYETAAGPLYVNAGIGTYYVPFRFNCRPELTLVTM